MNELPTMLAALKAVVAEFADLKSAVQSHGATIADHEVRIGAVEAAAPGPPPVTPIPPVE
jgi:hypothetical protein